MATETRVWGGLVLEIRTEYGSAARHNRGRYAGSKVHRLHCEYVVGVVPGSEHQPGSYGANFLKTGQPALFHASPACGCTQGQHAARPRPGLTEASVTCEKCLGKPAPQAKAAPVARNLDAERHALLGRLIDSQSWTRTAFREAMAEAGRPTHVEDLYFHEIDAANAILDGFDREAREQEAAERRLVNC